jgi:hypothetical protein
MEDSCASMAPVPTEGELSRFNPWESKERLERLFLTVLVAAALREYVVMVRISVVSAAAATVMPWPCVAISPKEETQSAA